MKLIDEIKKIEALYNEESRVVGLRLKKLLHRDLGKGAHVIREIEILNQYLEELEEAKEMLIDGTIKRQAYNTLKYGEDSFIAD